MGGGVCLSSSSVVEVVGAKEWLTGLLLTLKLRESSSLESSSSMSIEEALE
jgi:hypothetical protein